MNKKLCSVNEFRQYKLLKNCVLVNELWKCCNMRNSVIEFLQLKKYVM